LVVALKFKIVKSDYITNLKDEGLIIVLVPENEKGNILFSICCLIVINEWVERLVNDFYLTKMLFGVIFDGLSSGGVQDNTKAAILSIGLNIFKAVNFVVRFHL